MLGIAAAQAGEIILKTDLAAAELSGAGGDIVLKGFGDPTLTSAGLKKLALQLKASGIRRINGRILGDESWFDTQRTAPGWKASYYINECAPLSALIIDRAWYDHHTAHQPALAAAGELKRLLRKHGVAR